MNFKTYHDVYDYLKLLEDTGTYKHIDTSVIISPRTDNNNFLSQRVSQSPLTTPILYTYNYFAHPTVSKSATGTLGLIIVQLNYNLFYTIQWLSIYGGNSYMTAILANNPSSPQLYFSLAGTASGNVQFSALSTAADGTFWGTCQAVVSVGGTSISYILNINGAYMIGVPGRPGGASSVTTWMSVSVK